MDGFRTIEPKILYFGTPVALISSLNEDGGTNLAPISSFWALGWTFVLGLLDETKTADNLARLRECVINIPSPEMWQNVEKLAPLTGKNPVPELKTDQFQFEPDKFRCLRSDSDAQRNRAVGASPGMPRASGEPSRSPAHSQRRKAQSAWRRRCRRG